MERYSIYEAKAKLSAIIRAAKQRRRVCITERGRDVAWVVPAPGASASDLDERLTQLEAAGVVQGGGGSVAAIELGPTRPGALGRFLRDRDDT